MGSSVKEVQRKLDLSLEDIVQEDKKEGGNSELRSRKRRRGGGNRDGDRGGEVDGERSGNGESDQGGSGGAGLTPPPGYGAPPPGHGQPRGPGGPPPPGAFYPFGPPPPWAFGPRGPPPMGWPRGPPMPMPHMRPFPFDPRARPYGAPPPGHLGPPLPGHMSHHAPPNGHARFGHAPAAGYGDRPRGPHPPGYGGDSYHSGLQHYGARPQGPPPGAQERPSPGYTPPGDYGKRGPPAHEQRAEAPRAQLAPVVAPCGYQVRLSNLPPELTARDVAEAFGEVSQTRVESVDLLRDAHGRATGESLVVFGSLNDAQNVIRRYHGGDLNGRRLLAVYEGEVVATS